jgi:hypothetical protein
MIPIRGTTARRLNMLDISQRRLFRPKNEFSILQQMQHAKEEAHESEHCRTQLELNTKYIQIHWK